MNKLFLSLLIVSSSSIAFANPRNLKIQDLICQGVKVKSFTGEPRSGIGLYLESNITSPDATNLTMRTGTGPSKLWGSVPVFIKKVIQKSDGGYEITGKPKVNFAGGGSATFTMSAIRVNNSWKASATVVYKAWMKPASVREYNMTCNGFKVQ
jgi:hypothetical protein